MVPTIGDVHRQRSTGIELAYWAAYAVSDDTMLFTSVIQSQTHSFDAPEGELALPAVTKADKALHSFLRQHIDARDLAAGRARNGPVLHKRRGARGLL